MTFLIAQSDDPELLEWLLNANRRAGTFVSSIARAALVADPQNYSLLRAVILELRKKYPEYEPTEEVKAALRKEPA